MRHLLLVGILAASLELQSQDVIAPINGDATWMVVVGPSGRPGGVTQVYAVENNAPLGAIPSDSKFLAFGSDERIITFAYNGALAYIARDTVRELYPAATETYTWRSGGENIEERATREKAAESNPGAAGIRLNALPAGASGAGGTPASGSGANQNAAAFTDVGAK